MAWTKRGQIPRRRDPWPVSVRPDIHSELGSWNSLQASLPFCPVQIDTSLIEEDQYQFNQLFLYWASLKEAPMFDTSRAKDMTEMFWGCFSLERVPNYDFSSCVEASYMFHECHNLKRAPESLDTSKMFYAAYMFGDCFSLEWVPTIDLSGAPTISEWSGEPWSSFGGMFSDCPRLPSVTLTNTGGNAEFWNMFERCSSLRSVETLDLSGVTEPWEIGDIFKGCESLEHLEIRNCSVSISLEGTALRASALNNIFDRGLAQAEEPPPPEYEWEEPDWPKTIDITGTPGADSCDRSIAEDKGWVVVG